MSPVLDAAAALRIIASARRSGMGDGAICDALGITSVTLTAWTKKPDTVPQRRIREKLGALREKVRADRRKGATR